MTNSNINFTFFGSDAFSIFVLEELEKRGFLPTLIVTVPDAPKGRKLQLTPPPITEWAKEKGIEIYQPNDLKHEDTIKKLKNYNSQIFIVASFGKIIPQEILDIPSQKTLNVHPSLLPKGRGASPIETAILSDTKETGVTIMQMDDKMDHGPIVIQQKILIETWPSKKVLEEQFARIGGNLLADVLPKWVLNQQEVTPQNENEATYTQKIKKEDGLIDLQGNQYDNFRKIQAMDGWPYAYFFQEHGGKNIRVLITKAQFQDSTLKILKVVPEGKKEMSFDDFLRGLR